MASDGDSPATAPAAAAQPHPHEQTVTPWEVQGAEGVDGRLQAIDYTLLIKHFGTRPIDAALLARFERLTGVAPHRFLRRGIFFSHRELSHILDCHEQGKPWYLYTGRGPSSGAMHVGHMVPFIFCKWLQDVFHVPLVIQLTDDEKFLFKQELKMDAALRFANENAKDIIAFGFDPANTFIFSNLSYMNPDFYQNVVRIQKCITTSTSKAAFGFKDMDNVGKLAFVAVQACPAFSSTFPHVFGPKSNAHCLTPYFIANGAVVHNCAIDQDPYFRLTRDVAARLKLRKPALVHSKFFPALQGHGTKMSASDPNSAVYLSDTPAQIKNKIRKHAFSGGQVSREEHARLGGNPDVDVAYAYLTFFLDDDAELADLEARYRQGTLTTGEMKDRCVAVVGDVVGAVQARRKTVTDGTLQAFTTAASAEAAARAARHAAENAEAVETAPAAAETTAAPASAAS
ncbi:hypothetical protein CXG81DRAFT_30288 [Caulochytrium protostelioides]|uniref:Tryptophan--tRNA ligase, cytoplasmic n=1 Tax=Caulochytrium protostelioides TaxID=1555241 RepID=A0A4P9X273_9FUNG|nr:hypothetical protein CXG81DRAFT_30288 [Caulochytrium protostelioides]|eukprot:RKO99138.1 hypothetical protein CXG81DRAFT_30288 [Caulochytrium protostelioides]